MHGEVILFVHGTLRNGKRNHWMIRGCQLAYWSTNLEGYYVGRRRLWWLDLFECINGWHRIRHDRSNVNGFIYRRY